MLLIVSLFSDTEGVPSTAIREISTLKTLNHPSVVQMIDVILERNKIFMVFEYLNLDLKEFLDSSTVRLEEDLVKVFCGVLFIGNWNIRIFPMSIEFHESVVTRHRVLSFTFSITSRLKTAEFITRP